MRNELRRPRLSTSRFRAAILLAALWTLHTPRRAAAQLPSQQLSCQLFNATLATFSPLGDDDTVACVAGATPKGWLKSLTPGTPVRVVGGGGFGPVRVALFEFPLSLNVATTMERVAKGAGLSRLTHPRIASGGFVKGSVVPQEVLTFCGNTGAVIANVVDSTPTARLVSVIWSAEPGVLSTCRTSEPPEMSAPLAVPALTAPAGVRLTPGGSGFSNEHFETTARLDTSYTAEQLLAHYARQLRAGGWTVAPSSARGDGIAIRQLATRDARGEQWHGVLMILTGVREREVTLRMVRDRKDAY